FTPCTWASGHLSDSLALAHAMDARQPLLGLHPVGMSNAAVTGLRPGASFDELALHCAGVILEHDPVGPYRLLGFSFGAKLAFETARVLVRRGGEVSHLMMLDPKRPRPKPLGRTRMGYQDFRYGRRRSVLKRLCHTVSASYGLRSPPREIDEAHQVASLTHRGMPLALPRVLMVSAEFNRDRDKSRRLWQKLIGAGISFKSHPGDHMQMIDQTNAFSLGRKLEAWMVAID
ncbi:MAG: thioesterase domain-containing protein, partial [Alphaproteobacteria bacterium]